MNFLTSVILFILAVIFVGGFGYFVAGLVLVVFGVPRGEEMVQLGLVPFVLGLILVFVSKRFRKTLQGMSEIFKVWWWP